MPDAMSPDPEAVALAGALDSPDVFEDPLEDAAGLARDVLAALHAAGYRVVAAESDNAIREAHKALGSFIWLGNNLHNSGTETFREMYRASLADTVTAYNATRSEGERAVDPADRIDLPARTHRGGTPA